MQKGLFIVIDGPSGSGKNSIIQQVLKDLDKLNIKVVCIEETKEKNYNREKILEAKKLGDNEITKAILNERKKIYREKVIPHLSNKLIIANRGEPSTLAYQTLKNEITMEDIWDMHRIQNIPIPNLIVIANCSPDEAIRRENLRITSSEEKGKKSMSGKFSNNDRQLIHDNYENVNNFLKEKGVNLIYLNTDILNISEESKRIVEFIKEY